MIRFFIVTTAVVLATVAWIVSAVHPPHPVAAGKRPPPGMVRVPAGSFAMGSDSPDSDEDVRPLRQVDLAEFYIDRTEVTNADYRRFDPHHVVPPGEENLPVTDVTYDDATAYARWAGKRLPKEAEWEKAARGVDGRVYPWGNVWDFTRIAPRVGRPRTNRHAGSDSSCSLAPSRTQAVGSKPRGASPYGCLDMAGNAWEWVQGYYLGNRDQRILRGGAVGYGERACRTYNRGVEGSGST